MTTKEQIENLEAEKLSMMAQMKESDGRSSKCAKMGISFEDTYPEDYAKYVSANQRYNEIEEQLVPLYEELKQEEELKEPEIDEVINNNLN